MSIPEPDVHVRLSHEMHAALIALADVEQTIPSRLARRIVEDYITRKAHSAIVLAAEFKRLGIDGMAREGAGIEGRA